MWKHNVRRDERGQREDVILYIITNLKQTYLAISTYNTFCNIYSIYFISFWTSQTLIYRDMFCVFQSRIFQESTYITWHACYRHVQMTRNWLILTCWTDWTVQRWYSYQRASSGAVLAVQTTKLAVHCAHTTSGTIWLSIFHWREQTNGTIFAQCCIVEWDLHWFR